MFLILLLVAPALSEWVEISQHHVRKPARTHSFRPVPVADEYFEDTTRTTKIYLNQTLTERSWSRGNVNKVPKLGNIQRVQLDDSPIKAPSISVNQMRDSLNMGGANTVNKHDEKESASGADSDFMDTTRHKVSGGAEHERYKTTNRISTSNIENVNRQIISNTKKIFQETTNKDDRTETRLSNKKNRPLNQLERASFNKLGPRNPNVEDFKNNFKVPEGEQKTNVSLRPNIFRFDESGRNSAFTTAAETTNIRRHDLGNVPPVFVDEMSVEKITSSEKDFTQRNKHILNANLNTRDDKPKNPSNVIPNKLTNYEFVTKIDKPAADDMDATVSDDNKDPNIGISSEPERQNSEQEENVEASNKVNSLENLITFMKVVDDTIRKNTRRSVNSKTRYLTNLKNTILANIAERIDAAWPDDEPAKLPRTRRAAHASARGHLEIPSSESALMTISFLTFAVFLIKLVLQVIQTYKNKAMMVSPAVVAVGRAATKRSSKP